MWTEAFESELQVSLKACSVLVPCQDLGMEKQALSSEQWPLNSKCDFRQLDSFL